jgi:predicted nuclease of predicted toxin-antitoxin system
MKVSSTPWWSVYARMAMTSSTSLSCPPSIADEEVLQQANALGAVLLTADKDFGELVFRQSSYTPGWSCFALRGLANATKAEIVGEVCRDRAAELVDAFSVVAPGQVRIRRRS